MKAGKDSKKGVSSRTLVLSLVGGVVGAMAVTALLVNIFERKQEARTPYFRVVDLADDTEDPAVWGKNFPLHYEDYLRTADQVRTRYGGSEAVPRTPTRADPRSVVAQSRLEEDPRLRTLWAGYAFSKDFREERGHAHMLEDQVFTERQKFAQQPGACLNCHASMYVPYKEAGGGDAEKGFQALNSLPYEEARAKVKHPIACVDCHEPKTMALRVTRPAFLEGIRKVKALEGKPDYDPNLHATRQEMRSYVCGQCHVEYYFKGPEKRLTYPWEKGLKADDIMATYEESGFKDWTHAVTGAPVLKAQHPEFEMYNQGVHARAGVACADCHMPYKRVGASKVSDHHVRSPMLNIANACQTCHRWQEDELKARVDEIQGKTHEMRGIALDALMTFMGDMAACGKSGTCDPARLESARAEQRKAQFYLDFVEAENSMGFHAPQEAMRILGLSLEHTRRAERALWGVPASAPASAPAPAPTVVPTGPAD